MLLALGHDFVLGYGARPDQLWIWHNALKAKLWKRLLDGDGVALFLLLPYWQISLCSLCGVSPCLSGYLSSEGFVVS
jgi:hypothetical protein